MAAAGAMTACASVLGVPGPRVRRTRRCGVSARGAAVPVALSSAGQSGVWRLAGGASQVAAPPRRAGAGKSLRVSATGSASVGLGISELRGLEKLEVGPRATMSGRVRLPGSKSLTNRLLLLSILAEGETVLENVLDSDDIQAMLGAMRALGVTHEVEAEEGVPGALRVKVVGCAGAPPALRRGSGKEAGAELALNLGNAGTAMRPLTAAVALGDTDTLVTLDGVPRMRERPIEDLVVAMKQLGVDCKCTLGTGCPPVAVRASGLRGGRCQLSGKISSQFLTAMLFAAPYASEDVEIEIIDTLVSVPYVEMTVKLMRRWGVNVEVGEGWGSFRIPAGQCYKSPGKAFVEGDASSASYFLAGATVTGSTMVVEGCGKDSLQGDVFFADTMGQMGAQVEWGDTWVKVTGPPKGELKGIDVNMNAMPDAAMTLAVAALFAGLGLTLGALIVVLQEPSAFWIGIAGLALGWSYHGPPLQLVYRGWGELAVLLIYGPVIALSTYLIQRHQFSLDVLLLSLPLGIFISAFLWVNEFPDHDADLGANKRNLVVILGRRRASRLLPLIYVTGFSLLYFLPHLTEIDQAVWWGFVALPTASLTSYWTWHQPETFYRHTPAQPLALLTFVLYSVGICGALNLTGHIR